MLDTLTHPAAEAAAPFTARLAALGPQLDALLAEALAADMPSAIVMGLTWLRDDAAKVLADARAAQPRAEG